MEPWKQYAGLALTLVLAGAVGIYGFFATGGGGYKYGQRFKKAILGGKLPAQEGPIVDPGRGIVFPKPVDVMGEFVPLVVVLVVIGVIFFGYVMRRQRV